MLPRYIGVMGKSRCGKDTVAALLFHELTRRHKDQTVEIQHIAATLKVAVGELYGFRYDQLHGETKDRIDIRYGVSPRYAMTEWSQKIQAMHGSSFLVKRLLESCENTTVPNTFQRTIIVPDVRFHHDCEEIRNRQGILIRVTRPSAELQLSNEAHIDELAHDFLICNDGSKDLLAQRVQKLVETEMTRCMHNVPAS